MDINFLIYWLFSLGAFLAIVAKGNSIRNNPEIMRRHETGEIHWPWLIYDLTIEMVVGGVVAVGAYAVIDYSGVDVTSEWMPFFAGSAAIVGNHIFTKVQEKLISKADEQLDRL
jgi:hypothetical protein